MSSTAKRAADYTCQCGRRKLLLPYESAITVDAAGVEYGEVYSALVCPECDGIGNWPRMASHEVS